MTDDDGSSLDGIRRRAVRMQHTRERPGDSPLRGLGAFGVIGWSIAIPTVGGALLGLWLDRVARQQFSWTLALILAGLVLGAVVAWDWVARENRRALDDQPPPLQEDKPGD
ncbi:MAG TPA: AtpZ/AtpI family protein [Rubrivivax sp.]|nr:AtpZ/AtpI family protein [Rubrivivax sp.]HRZ59263.1 AtpZ/AtpI family protein [Rubrivivax sp.]